MKDTICHSCPEGLAMATVPLQNWCEPYDSWETALEEGTIFSCLNLPFFRGEKEIHFPKPENSALNGTAATQESLMFSICCISFALNDLTLYLDTHPDCTNGISLFHQLLKDRKQLLDDYAHKYNPLTQCSMTAASSDTNCYCWAEGPLPWEGGHI